LNLRLPPDMHAALKRIAEDQDRSLNAQIIRALREWLAQQRAPEGGEAPKQ
jgi:hypothetical protein